MPSLLVFAGPNGSGKSTIADTWDQVGIYINADIIKQIRGCSDLEAAQESELLREFCLTRKRDFSFETVLSTRRNLDLLHMAKAQGYSIESVFIMTSDAELNVLRVKSRVLSGGHPVPVEKIRSRYTKSLANLKELIDLSDRCTVFDNTELPEIVITKREATIQIIPNKFWTERDLFRLIR